MRINLSLRNQLLVSFGLVITVTSIALVIAVALLLQLTNTVQVVETENKIAVALQEMAISIQYSAYSVSSYGLGRFENREEFVEHQARFNVALEDFKSTVGQDDVGAQRLSELDQQFTEAALVYFETTDRLFRADTQSAQTRLQVEADDAWEVANNLGDDLDVFLSRRVVDAILVANENIITSNALVLSGLVTTAVIGVLGLIASLVLASQTIRLITNPITSLTEVSNALAGGNFEVRADESSSNEVGQLGASFNTMAGQLSTIVDELEDRVAERTRDMETANDVGRLMTRVENQEELLTVGTQFIQNSYELYYTQIYLLDSARRYAILRAGTGDVGKELMSRSHKLDVEETSLVARAVQSRESILVPDTEASDIHRANELLPDTRSELSVPLIVGNDIIGVLDMQHTTAGRFNEENMAVFETMASQVASAIRRTESFADVQVAVDRAEAVNRRLTEDTWEGYLAQLQDGHKIGYQYDLESPTALGESEYVSFDGSDPVNVPVLLRGQQIGAIQVGDDRPHEWTEEELALVQDVSDRVGQALEQFRAFDEVDKRAAEMETVAQVSTAATTILDIDELLKTVSDLTKDRFGLYHAHIYLLDQNEQFLVLSGGAGEAGAEMLAKGLRIPFGREDSLVATAGRDRKATIVNDVTLNPNYLPNPLLPDTKSEMALPMVVGNELIGVLDVQADRVGYFTDEDVRIQETLASQVAVAVRNARLIKEVTDVQFALDQHAIVAITDQRGIITFVNDKFVDISKYPREELIGQDHRILNSGFHSKDFMKDLWTTIANGKVWNNEVYNKAKDGSYYWVDTTIVPYLNAQGKPEQYIAIRADITERKQQEAEVLRRASEMETVAQVGTVVTTILDVDELLQSVTDLTKERFGLYHAHIYLLDDDGDNLVLAAGAGDAGRQMKKEGRSITASREDSLVALVARDREPLIVNDVSQNPNHLANPLLPDTAAEMALPMVVGDTLVGVLDVQSENVDHFTNDDMLIQSTLASQVAVAVRNALAFEQERATIESLKEVDRLKQQFLANMSHELRTPLNSIIGYSEVLLDGVDGDLTEDAVEDVDAIHNSGKHLLSIINEILDLARIDAGEMDLNIQPLAPSEFLGEIVKAGTILVKDKGVTLELIEDSPVISIAGDEVRLRQITWNLVSNAVKFTEQGAVTVRYGMQDEDTAYIRVKDSGIGMNEEDLALIFQRFRQVDESSTRRAGGTGLGLTITRQLIEMHGGEIHVESVYGEGSTFWFTIPVITELEVQRVSDD